jgi:hypothetical protein
MIIISPFIFGDNIFCPRMDWRGPQGSVIPEEKL